MRFFSLIVISACMLSAQASGTEAQTPLTGEQQDKSKNKTDTQQLPPKVPLECTNTFVPVSERDLYALTKQDAGTGADATDTSATSTTKGANATQEDVDVNKLSDKQTMALCETATESGAGLCDLTSCKIPQATVCTQCSEMDQDSTDFTAVKGSTPVDKVTCDSGYALKTPSNKQTGNMCMTEKKTYICAGECQGAMACQQCYTDNSSGKGKTGDSVGTTKTEDTTVKPKTDNSTGTTANP